MKGSNRRFVLLLVVIGGVGLTTIWAIDWSQRPAKRDTAGSSADGDSQNDQAPVIPEPNLSSILDQAPVTRYEVPPRTGEEHMALAMRRDYPHPGYSPYIDPETNESTQALHETLSTGEHLERVSFYDRVPFDQSQFEADPGKYINTPEPGRAFSPAQPADDVTPLQVEGSRFRNIVQGDSTSLTAKAEPGSPVTFHISELGKFENELKTITVLADDSGVATANYTATTGVQGLVTIVAASPLHTEQLQYFVDVSLPVPAASAQ